MKLTREDGSEPTPLQVSIWLGQRGADDGYPELTQVCEELAGAFLTCGERCGLERFINHLVDTVHRLEQALPADPEKKLFPWQQHGDSPLRQKLFQDYLTTGFIGSDTKNVPAALDKIGSSRVLTPEERSGYPY